MFFPQVALGGFALGLVAGKITVFWLQHVFNDGLVEITITLVSTYLTYYIGQFVLNVSGVLAVVMLGLEIKQHKTSISPEVEVFLHRYMFIWRMPLLAEVHVFCWKTLAGSLLKYYQSFLILTKQPTFWDYSQILENNQTPISI